MFALIRLVFLSCLAVFAGVAAVSIPVMGKTVAEHVRGWAGPIIEEWAASNAGDKPRLRVADLPPAEELTDEDRQALERLLGDRAAAP
jgi:hypothetical protein